MKCYLCKSELIWGGDHTYEDYGIDGDGIVTNLNCSNDKCEVELIEVYQTNEKQNSNTAKENPLEGVQ